MTSERTHTLLATLAALALFTAGVSSMLGAANDRAAPTAEGPPIDLDDEVIGCAGVFDEGPPPPPPDCFDRPDTARCLRDELEAQAAAYIAGEPAYRPTGTYRRFP